MRRIRARRRRQRRQIRQRRQPERPPEETLAGAVVAGARARRVREVSPKNAAVGVADDEHEARALAAVLGSFAVEGGEGAAVLLEGVGEVPVVGELQAGRDEEADFFGDGFAEESGGEGRGVFVAGEGEGGEGRWLEGREAPCGRVEDGGGHGAVVVCAEGAGEGGGGVVVGDAAAYAGEGVGYGFGEVVEGGGGQVGECL